MDKKRIFLKKSKKAPPILPPFELDGFDDFMRKEIFSQPVLIDDFLGRYIKGGKINLDYLKIKIDKVKRIYILSDSDNFGAALAAAYNFEVLVDIPAIPQIIFEFNCSNPVLDKGSLVIIIGTKPEEHQCCQALSRVKACGAKAVGIFDFQPNNPMAVSINFQQKSPVPIASYTLRYTALCLLALYFGGQNQVITELYISIATKMLLSLGDKIKKTLEREYLVKNAVIDFDFDDLVITGTNVDFAASLYSCVLMSFASGKRICPICVSNMKEKENAVALVSSSDFLSLLPSGVKFMLKVLPESIECNGDLLLYDDTIPLYNPILISTVMQLAAYHVAILNGIDLNANNVEERIESKKETTD